MNILIGVIGYLIIGWWFATYVGDLNHGIDKELDEEYDNGGFYICMSVWPIAMILMGLWFIVGRIERLMGRR